MKRFFPLYVRLPLIFFTVFGAMEYFIDSGDRPAFIKYPILSLFLCVFFFLLVAIEIVVDAIDTVTYRLLTEEQKKKLEDATDFSLADTKIYRTIRAWFVRPERLSDERLLLDHDYDGIRELDNKLPPWWVNMFYLTMVFAAIYLIRFEIMDGDNPEMELRKELAQAKRDIDEWKKTAPDQMTEEKVTLLSDAASLSKGKVIFQTNCVACHRADAGGQVGPNLTDDHWIFGGSIKNVFHTVTNGGRDGKGMIAWKTSLKPTEIQCVSSYVLSLQGSNPKDPKAPEGDVWKEELELADKTAKP